MLSAACRRTLIFFCATTQTSRAPLGARFVSFIFRSCFRKKIRHRPNKCRAKLLNCRTTRTIGQPFTRPADTPLPARRTLPYPPGGPGSYPIGPPSSYLVVQRKALGQRQQCAEQEPARWQPARWYRRTDLGEHEPGQWAHTAPTCPDPYILLLASQPPVLQDRHAPARAHPGGGAPGQAGGEDAEAARNQAQRSPQ